MYSLQPEVAMLDTFRTPESGLAYIYDPIQKRGIVRLGDHRSIKQIETVPEEVEDLITW
jgi:hypothetical protein